MMEASERERERNRELITDVLLLEFTSQVALDEGGLSGTTVTDYEKQGGRVREK